MKEVKLIRYAYKNKGKSEIANLILSIYDMIDSVDESEITNKETISWHLKNVIEFIEPKDLGLTDWN